MSFVHDPDATLPYAVDWAPVIATLDGDTIATAEWIAPDALTIVDQGVSGANAHTGLISGGTPGHRYQITSRIVTAAGATADQSFTLWVQEA